MQWAVGFVFLLTVGGGTGYVMPEWIGKLHFLGLTGMPRRYW